MTAAITLYEYGPTRSARVRWTLMETGLAFTSVEKQNLIGSDELKKAHPLGKLPAVLVDGRPLFKSAAICTMLADMAPDKGLIAEPGTWARALHDQWVCFTLSEMEVYTWCTARNTFILPEEERVPGIVAQNTEAFARGAGAMDAALADADYLVDNRFSVTDIIAGFTVAWGCRQGLLADFSNLESYLDRLVDRPHCLLTKD